MKHILSWVSRQKLVKSLGVTNLTRFYRSFVQSQALDLMRKTQPVLPTDSSNFLIRPGELTVAKKRASRLSKSVVASSISLDATGRPSKHWPKETEKAGTSLEAEARKVFNETYSIDDAVDYQTSRGRSN